MHRCSAGGAWHGAPGIFQQRAEALQGDGASREGLTHGFSYVPVHRITLEPSRIYIYMYNIYIYIRGCVRATRIYGKEQPIMPLRMQAKVMHTIDSTTAQAAVKLALQRMSMYDQDAKIAMAVCKPAPKKRAQDKETK